MNSSPINRTILPAIKNSIDKLNQAINCLNRATVPSDFSNDYKLRLENITKVRNNLVNLENWLKNSVSNLENLETDAYYSAKALPKNALPVRNNKYN